LFATLGGLRVGAAWFAVYFLAALLPRLSPILAGTAFADDLIHLPDGHLLSYRFVNYVELAFWQWMFGPDYLLTLAPSIIGALYTAALCSALRTTLNTWAKSPRLEFSILPLLIPLHPLWNTFIAWHVTAVYVLLLFLIVFGYKALASRPALGIALIALGVSGYQVHVGLLPALLFAEASLRRTPLLRRIAQCGAAVAVYVVSTKVATLAGLQTWGGRGFGITWSAAPVANNIAVITQPLLSFYGSIEASWRFWLVPFLLLAASSAIRRPRRFALAPVALPVIAASVILLTNAPPSGPRVAGAIWLATILAVIHSRAATVALAAFAIAAVPVAVTDAENRTRAWRADQTILAQLPAGAPVAVIRTDVAPLLPPEWRTRPIVMQDYAPVTPYDYSNVRVRPVWFFERFGHPVVPPQPGVQTIDASTLRWQ
jgi:hypothetical protein